jgi:hypothetical protein
MKVKLFEDGEVGEAERTKTGCEINGGRVGECTEWMMMMKTIWMRIGKRTNSATTAPLLGWTCVTHSSIPHRIPDRLLAATS